MAGDCRTALAGFLVDVEFVFRFAFRPVAGVPPEVRVMLLSKFISTGDVVSEVSDPRNFPYTDR